MTTTSTTYELQPKTVLLTVAIPCRHWHVGFNRMGGSGRALAARRMR